MINEDLAMAYDLKMAERFDPKARITQCIECQRYGYTSRHCMSKQKCGHCGGDHTTEECSDMSQAPRKSRAACSGGQHASWSTACPARLRDIQRAKTVRRTMPRLYPVAGKDLQTPIFGEIPHGKHAVHNFHAIQQRVHYNHQEKEIWYPGKTGGIH